jgi:hypothetical protein
MSEPSSNQDALFAEFKSEHAKRERRVTIDEEREAAWRLMSEVARSPEYLKNATPSARMAHERELLAQLKQIVSPTREASETPVAENR